MREVKRGRARERRRGAESYFGHDAAVSGDEAKEEAASESLRDGPGNATF